MKRLLFLPIVAVCAASSSAIVVDSFSTPYFNTVNSGSWVDFQAGTMLSGERDVQFEVVSNPANTFSDLDINGAGQATFSNGFGMVSNTYLQYDRLGDEVGNTGPGFVLNNGGNGSALFNQFADAVRVSFLGNDLAVQVTAVLRLNGVILDQNSGVRSAGGGAGNLDIALNAGAMASADSLTFVFTGAPGADFAITELSTVPEPATLVALAVGLGLVRRAKSRRS